MNDKRRRAATAAMTTMVITAALLTSSVATGAPALASGNCGNLQTGHCYAESAQGTTAGHTPIYLNNVGADLEVNCLAVRNDNTEFANWEMWVETDDTNPNSTTDSGYWVEEGYTAGTVLSGNTYYTGFQWYWADNRPGGGYNEHFIEWATANQYKNVTVTFAGGSNWDVYLGGSFVGESTNNAAYAGGTVLGAEMAVDNNGQVWANSKNWQYTNGGSWSPVDPTFTGYINDVPGYGISQSYNPTDVSVWTPSDQCGTTPQVAPQPTPVTGSAVPLTSVRSIAARAVATYVTGTPTTATSVQTTRGAANALFGSEVDGPSADQPVYLVQELGSFSLLRQSPAGAQSVIDSGAVHIVISATTGQVLDWGIQGPGNLQSLGRVTSLS